MIWGSLLFNGVVFSLTVLKTWRSSRVAKSIGAQNSFYAHFLKDGMLTMSQLSSTYMLMFLQQEACIFCKHRCQWGYQIS